MLLYLFNYTNKDVTHLTAIFHKKMIKKQLLFVIYIFAINISNTILSLTFGLIVIYTII